MMLRTQSSNPAKPKAKLKSIQKAPSDPIANVNKGELPIAAKRKSAKKPKCRDQKKVKSIEKAYK